MVFNQIFDIPSNRQITLPNEAPTGKVNIFIYPVQEDAKQQAPMPHRSNEKLELTGDFSEPMKGRVLGCLKGQVWMSDDFNEPLEDFKDYM